MIKKLTAAASAALFVSIGGHASAEVNANELAQCMVNNHGETQEKIFRDLMIAALNDDLETLQTSVLALGTNMLTVAVSSCGMPLADAQTPAFEEAAGIYGEYLGQKVITDAFAKIGL